MTAKPYKMPDAGDTVEVQFVDGKEWTKHTVDLINVMNTPGSGEIDFWVLGSDGTAAEGVRHVSHKGKEAAGWRPSELNNFSWRWPEEYKTPCPGDIVEYRENPKKEWERVSVLMLEPDEALVDGAEIVVGVGVDHYQLRHVSKTGVWRFIDGNYAWRWPEKEVEAPIKVTVTVATPDFNSEVERVNYYYGSKEAFKRSKRKI